MDAYSGYDAALSLDGRSTAYCLAHARRKFDELVKANASVVAAQAIQRIAWLYRIEADAKALTTGQCHPRLIPTTRRFEGSRETLENQKPHLAKVPSGIASRYRWKAPA